MTSSLTDVEWVPFDPPSPLIVSVKLPTAAVAVVATVSTDDPPDVTDAGSNVPAAPAGRPLTDRLTVCADPDTTCVVTEKVVVPPCTRVRLAGVAPTLKSSGCGVLTVSVTWVECVIARPVPLIVSVNVPAGVDAAVDTVSVAPPPAVTADGA